MKLCKPSTAAPELFIDPLSVYKMYASGKRRAHEVRGFQRSCILRSVARSNVNTMRRLTLVLGFVLLCVGSARAQEATFFGLITDQSGAVLPQASVQLRNEATGAVLKTESNATGAYTFPFVQPGAYDATVSKAGFKTFGRNGVKLDVGQNARMDFVLEVGSAAESVTVTAGENVINTTDASVSTVVDRQFVENLPLNGRSFQSLLYMTPGVTTNAGSAATNDGASGGFVVNGQRGDENYWMIDGASANIGIQVGTPGPGGAGAVGATNVLGGTMALVSVDALEEFRIDTSTFSPEFGRGMGGQIDIKTRSGTNRFHGNVFEYLRNTVFDANNWFNDYHGLKKTPEIQNDYGGVVGGPIVRNKAFFFFSYEGIRLIQPGNLTATTPDAAARAAANSDNKPYLDMWPAPPAGVPDTTPGSGIVLYSSNFSTPQRAYAASLRADYQLSPKLSLFARYNHSPSRAQFTGPQVNEGTLEAEFTKTATAGLTWLASNHVVDDLRANYSVSGGKTSAVLSATNGSAGAPSDSWMPSPFSYSNANLYYVAAFGTGMVMENGAFAKNYQRQWNFVDTLSVVAGSHDLKFGVDYRRMIPTYGQAGYWGIPIFLDPTEMETGSPFLMVISSYFPGRFKLQNLSSYGQDTWRVNPRLTITYGLRWDVDYAPQTVESTPLPGITGFSLTNLSNLAYAPGKPPYTTHWGNVAPRFGGAYRIHTTPGRETVLRGGWGIFYGLADSELLNLEAIDEPLYPYGTNAFVFSTAAGGTGLQWPPTPAQAKAPANEMPNATNGYPLYGLDPNINLPWAQEWNVSLEQSLGTNQSFTLSYLGAVDNRLQQPEALDNPNANYAAAWLVTQEGSANYHGLQAVFQRRLSHGLQALVDYTWSHSIDDGSYGNWLTWIYPGETSANFKQNRGNSDFDVPQSFSAALTYQPPAAKNNLFLKAITRDWSTNNIVTIRSGPPENIISGDFAGRTSALGVAALIRPDQVPNVPLYLHGSKYPGGKAVNPAAFSDPPLDTTTNGPTRQGTFPRNKIRAPGLAQWNFSVQREFPIYEDLHLRFEADLFNVLNHPSFGPYNGSWYADGSNVLFGQTTGIWATSSANGGQNALYAPGGNRSGQFSLKLTF